MIDGRDDKLLWRLTAYTVLVAAVAQALVTASGAFTGHEFTVEGGPIELVQFGLSITAAALFAQASVAKPRLRSLFIILALVAAMAAMREMDDFWAQYLFKDAYWIIDIALLGWAWMSLRSDPANLASLGGQIRTFVGSPSFIMCWAGLIVIVVFAQVFGQKQLWINVMNTSDLAYRTAKNMAEEGSELIGYMLLAFAAFEARFVSEPQQPTQKATTQPDS